MEFFVGREGIPYRSPFSSLAMTTKFMSGFSFADSELGPCTFLTVSLRSVPLILSLIVAIMVSSGFSFSRASDILFTENKACMYRVDRFIV